MQVTNSCVFEGEITDNAILSLPVTKRISKNYQVANDVLAAVITELNSVQNELIELRNRSDTLQMKNDKLIDCLKLLLEDINMKSCELKDVDSQCEHVQMQEFGINCSIQSDLEIEMKSKEKSMRSSVNGKPSLKGKGSVETENYQSINSFKHERKSSSKISQSTNNEVTDCVETFRDRPNIDKNDTLDIGYSKNEMLSYLARYKIDFLKFLQCNTNTIISGGFSELVRRFSVNSSNSHNESAQIGFADTRRKLSAGDKTQKRNSRSSRSAKSTRTTSATKPGVIDTGDHAQDPGLKSSLYDDLDLHDLSDLKGCADVTGPISTHNSVSKIGREKRLHTKGGQSKMNLLRSRTDIPKIKKIEQWKTQISKSFQLDQQAISQYDPIDKYRNKHEILKPKEAVLTKMKEQLPKRSSLKSSDEQVKNSPDVEHSKHQPTLPVVRYDLSISDDSSFHLDSKPDIIIKLQTTKGSTETTKVLENMPTISPTKNSGQINDRYSKHKHKHSSKKKTKKISKDLEDGEII